MRKTLLTLLLTGALALGFGKANAQEASEGSINNSNNQREEILQDYPFLGKTNYVKSPQENIGPWIKKINDIYSKENKEFIDLFSNGGGQIVLPGEEIVNIWCGITACEYFEFSNYFNPKQRAEIIDSAAAYARLYKKLNSEEPDQAMLLIRGINAQWKLRFTGEKSWADSLDNIRGKLGLEYQDVIESFEKTLLKYNTSKDTLK